MGARANSWNKRSIIDSTVEQSSLRRYLRYRFAELLTVEKFDEALSEALVAYSTNQILQCDLTFVIGIVKTAERMGRVKIDSTRIPADLLLPNPKIEFAQRGNRTPTPSVDA